MPATLLVATETHLIRRPDGQVYSTTGVDGYGFWTRYLDIFDRVVVTARTGIAPTTDLKSVPVEGPGVLVAPLPDYRGPWGYLRVRVSLATAMRRALEGADALCLRVPGPIASLAWRLRNGLPFGVEVVGDPLDGLSSGAARSVARPFARAVLARHLRAMCRDAEAASYVTAGALQRRYPTRGWSTSYSSIQLDDDAFVSEEAVRERYGDANLAQRGTPDDPWRLTLVGSLAQLHKAPDVTIRALSLCRSGGLHAILTLVGDGAERRMLEDYAKSCGLADRVTFVGHVSAGNDVRRVLDSTDIFVLPSRHEGLPRAMIEAMARGVASIGSSVGGIPELLPAARLAPPGSPEGLAEIIVRLCENRTELLESAVADRATAMNYRASVLRPKRRACYARIREAIDRRSRKLSGEHLAF